MGKIGRWESASGRFVDTEMLSDAIMDILAEYGDVIYQATEAGLDVAEKVFISNLKVASPKDKGNFAKAWKSKGKKYKLVRYIGNTTTVIGKDGQKIALSNITEYSTKHGRPFIKDTFNQSIPEMAQAVVNEIKKEA